ncbi:YfhO family protein [Cyclobacterium sp. SYSU L10401]|uniref:YfhO family protein n=1 Tax=Cyclobacterium sp. SYSU L10401 TaxID=2678657 RepID=UPI0013D359F8|nr:YfhO family protein [Cyclobacterium sp. SYSU L10401]
MNVNLKEAVLPHFLAILSFYLIVIIYFSPIVFEGKMIFQSDILQWEGSAKELLEHRARTGEEALWTNSMFGGMPAYLIHLDPKGDITNTLIKILTIGLPHPVSGLFFGMVSMYLLLMVFKVRPVIAALASWAFAFNTFNFLSLEAGHNAKIWAVSIVPLILAGVHLAFSSKKLLGLSLTALAVLLQLKFNHLQITYYTLILVLIYGMGQLVKAFREKQLINFSKITALLLAGAILGGLGNLARLTSVLEYGKYSIRGERNLPQAEENDSGLDRAYAFNWSNGKLETLTLLIPNYFGGASQQALPENSAAENALRTQGMEPQQINQFVKNAPTYWGDQPFTGGPIYGGAIMIFLFILGILFAPPLYRNVLLAMTLVTLMLSWGKNLEWFNYTLFDYLPGYNKFRAVSMALGITLLVIPILGALGLEQFYLNREAVKTKATFFKALGITAGLILLAVVFAHWSGFGGTDSSYPDWLQAALKTDRKSLLYADTFRSAMFIGATALLLSLALFKKMKMEYAIMATGLLLLVDLWGVNRRYLDQDSFTENPSEQHFAATPADEKIMQDQGYFRVLNLQNPFNDARTSYRFNSIGGYHGAKMSRYQDLIERILDPEISAFVEKAQEGNFDYAGIPVLNMLNTRYIMAGRGENAVFRNPEANGAAWFPEEIIPVSNNEEEISTLSALDTKSTATYPSADAANTPASGAGKLSLESNGPDQLVYSGQVERKGLAVFSEIFYSEGWQATVNGQEAEIHRVNYLLRGLVLPEGEVRVEMSYQPQAYYLNRTLSAIFQYAVLGLVLFAGYMDSKKHPQT